LLYNESKTDLKTPVSLAKIYRSDGLAWSESYQFDFVPTELTFKPETGELTISGGESSQIVVDKNGKLKN
jgi:hypothetical protein